MNMIPLLRRIVLGLGLVGLGVFFVTQPALAWFPVLVFTPSSWTAGPIDPNTTTTLTFTLTNTGPRASSTITVTLSGALEFTTTGDTCTGKSLGPGKSCTVTVQYAPPRIGEVVYATLSATGKDPGIGGPVSASAPLRGSSTGTLGGQALCEQDGGTFSNDPVTNTVAVPAGSTFYWSCNNAPTQISQTLLPVCANDAGLPIADVELVVSQSAPWDSSCITP
jgi:hypothetical protein